MVPGSGPGAVKLTPDMKAVLRQGVLILHYEWGLFATAMAKVDYGESDLMDNQHTVSEGLVRPTGVHQHHHAGASD